MVQSYLELKGELEMFNIGDTVLFSKGVVLYPTKTKNCNAINTRQNTEKPFQ